MTHKRLRGEHGIVLDWLLRIGIWFVILGVILFDAGSIVVGYLGLDGTANDMAIGLSTDIGSGSGQLKTPVQIEEAAEALADEADAKLVRAEVDSEGTLHIKLRRIAPTLVVGKIGPIKKWAVLTAVASASTK